MVYLLLELLEPGRLCTFMFPTIIKNIYTQDLKMKICFIC